MPDTNNPREVVIRELYRIIKFDYVTTDMQAIRAALIKYADDEIVYRQEQAKRDTPS